MLAWQEVTHRDGTRRRHSKETALPVKNEDSKRLTLPPPAHGSTNSLWQRRKTNRTAELLKWWGPSFPAWFILGRTGGGSSSAARLPWPRPPVDLLLHLVPSPLAAAACLNSAGRTRSRPARAVSGEGVHASAALRDGALAAGGNAHRSEKPNAGRSCRQHAERPVRTGSQPTSPPS